MLRLMCRGRGKAGNRSQGLWNPQQCALPRIHFGLQEKMSVHTVLSESNPLAVDFGSCKGLGTGLPQHTGPLILGMKSSLGRGIRGDQGQGASLLLF